MRARSGVLRSRDDCHGKRDPGARASSQADVGTVRDLRVRPRGIDKVADRLLLGRRRCHHREYARPIELDELPRVPTVRLDALARLARDQRRRDDLAYDATRRLETTLQRVPACTGLVADTDLSPAPTALQAPNKLPDRPLVVVDRKLFGGLLPRLQHGDDQRPLVRVDPNPRDRSFHDRLPSHAALARKR